ncbi:TPR repeat-containing protein YrrB [Salinivirga cyanobacteriivorans]|uniref:TPR repeat-containing protein YrrB n=1 Tax=Salinivirga cyanobacteriivorans TaxID=1307839 RepID=A0A0S2I0J8_9BACT|nr:tetratricopeptide repeat protein [Salinivirga cyanobacteriivorans]ALO15701.1 TPR repeat-containing protein YrrB [Salinivirga cyanobacteriivorans]
MNYFIILIITTLIFFSCTTQKEVSRIPAPDLSEKEVRQIEGHLVDYKRNMLYEEDQKALKHLKSILSVDSTHPVAHYERAKYYYQKENYDSAFQDINIAIKRNPDKFIYQEFRLMVTQSAGDINKTNRFYDQLLGAYPDNQKLWFNAAEFLLKSKQYEKALTLVNNYEERFGFNNQILVNKFKLLHQLDELKKLEKELVKYSEEYPENVKVLELLGEFYFKTDRVDKGVETYNRLLTIDSDNTVALLSMADYYRANKLYDKSFNYIERVINSKDLDVNKKIEVLVSFMQISKQDPKLSYYFSRLVKSLKEQYGNHSEVQLLYANLLVREGKYKAAQEEYANSLNASPDNLNAWVQLIMVDNELEQNVAIIDHATKALEYFPNQSELYYYRGISYMILEQYDKAMKDLEFGNKITGKNDPLKFQFLYFLGETYYNLDSVQLAFNTFDKAIDINPNEISLLNNYAYYLSEHNMELDKAKDMSLKTIKQDPDNSTYLDTYAWILFQMENYADALTYIEKAILNGGSSSSVIMEHYGDILYKLGKKDEAITAWEEAQLLPNPTDKLLEKVEKQNYVE